MPELVVRDVVMWTKHLHGDPNLRAQLNGLPGGAEVELLVDGVRGHWRKMSDGKDGRPTTGLTPQGRMADFWRELYATRSGESVSIGLPDGDPKGVPAGPTPTALAGGAPPLMHRTREAILAAREAFLRPCGWSSEGRTLTREEMHER